MQRSMLCRPVSCQHERAEQESAERPLRCSCSRSGEKAWTFPGESDAGGMVLTNRSPSATSLATWCWCICSCLSSCSIALLLFLFTASLLVDGCCLMRRAIKFAANSPSPEDWLGYRLWTPSTGCRASRFSRWVVGVSHVGRRLDSQPVPQHITSVPSSRSCRPLA